VNSTVLFFWHRYSEVSNNCFDFVLQCLRLFLRTFCIEIPDADPTLTWDAIADKEKFCSAWIVPRTRRAARYVSLYRRLLCEEAVVDDGDQRVQVQADRQLVNVESCTTHLWAEFHCGIITGWERLANVPTDRSGPVRSVSQSPEPHLSRGRTQQRPIFQDNLTEAPCKLRGCKNWPAPFPGQMSYKATKPGLVLFYILACFNNIVSLFIRTLSMYC